MKTKLTVLFLFINFISNAQIREKDVVEISPYFGYIRSNYFGGSDVKNNTAIGNTNLGVNLDIFLNSRFSIKTGLEYIPLGSSALVNKYGINGFTDVRVEDHLDFISVPVNVKLHFGINRNWYCNFGPSLSYLISAKSDGIKITEGVNKLQLGLNLGIGYKFLVTETFSLAVEHQQYYSGINNLKTSRYNRKVYPMYNFYGSLNIKAIFRI